MKLNEITFENFHRLIYANFGIELNSAKREMFQAKLNRLLHRSNINSYDDYYQYICNSPAPGDWASFVDEITVNTTEFFREMNHFEFLRNQNQLITRENPRILKHNMIRVWSAGCSTGEEPYSLAIWLKEFWPNIQVNILATDLSARVLRIAQQGRYPSTIARGMTPPLIRKYLCREDSHYEVIPAIKEMVTFRQFNLIDEFPFQNTFDLIMCRNVMIYFDSRMQQNMIEKFYQVLAPGGILFIGHSESFSNKKHQYRYMEPTIYMK